MELKIKQIDNYLLIRLLIEGREIELGMFNAEEARKLALDIRESYNNLKGKIQNISK